MEADLQAALKSAFEWEAHSAAITFHFESQIASEQVRYSTLLQQKQSECDEILQRTTGGLRSELLTTSQQISSGTCTEEGTTNDTQMGVKEAIMLNTQARLMALTKTWTKMCDRAWEINILRRLFDALTLNVVLERTKRAYQHRCLMYIQQEEKRVREIMSVEMTALTSPGKDSVQSPVAVDKNVGSLSAEGGIRRRKERISKLSVNRIDQSFITANNDPNEVVDRERGSDSSPVANGQSFELKDKTFGDEVAGEVERSANLTVATSESHILRAKPVPKKAPKVITAYGSNASYLILVSIVLIVIVFLRELSTCSWLGLKFLPGSLFFLSDTSICIPSMTMVPLEVSLLGNDARREMTMGWCACVFDWALGD